MRHASIAIMFGTLCLLAAIGHAVMSSKPVDPGFDGDGYRTFPTTEEAAPEMLEALRDAATNGTSVDWYNRARAAIAKATGGAE